MTDCVNGEGDMSQSPAEILPCERAGSYEVTRFNALRHGVLSRYTVLPWESEAEYHELLNALVQEHQPHGPTEEHLVEELAGILWRKRRLRLAEAASFRRGLEDATSLIRNSQCCRLTPERVSFAAEHH